MHNTSVRRNPLSASEEIQEAWISEMGGYQWRNEWKFKWAEDNRAMQKALGKLPWSQDKQRQVGKGWDKVNLPEARLAWKSMGEYCGIS